MEAMAVAGNYPLLNGLVSQPYTGDAGNPVGGPPPQPFGGDAGRPVGGGGPPTPLPGGENPTMPGGGLLNGGGDPYGLLAALGGKPNPSSGDPYGLTAAQKAGDLWSSGQLNRQLGQD